MTWSRAQRLKSWINKKKNLDEAPESSKVEEPLVTPVQLQNPFENYYRHKAKLSLPFFYRFALQTRSIAIRDVFSKIASNHSLDLWDLLSVIASLSADGMSERERNSLEESFNAEILLVLADLLANTARDELDTHSAVKIYDFVRQVHGDQPFSDQNKLQYVEALHELGHYSDADWLASTSAINDIAPLQQELLVLHRMWRTADTPQEWLKELNQLYRKLGMTEVQLRGRDSIPLMDRLTVLKVEPLEGSKISVIMPTFSPAPGIRTAIRSLLEQSWRNLEIIVVNDASPAEFRPVFDDLEELDSRIRIIHLDENAGSYVARNAGLAVATGDFVTTHDDDDWSHPDKLAIQIRVMLEDDSIVATTSAHIRTSENMEFRRVNMRAQFLQMNYSSLMFRRSIPEEIGPWDTVNKGGDSEFYTRLLENFGTERVVGLHDQPLSFSRVWDGSLTSGEMSGGYFGYSRLLYRWAFRQWHWSSGKEGQKAIRKPGDDRPYAIPATFESGQRNKDLGQFDVIYVTDFFRQAKQVNRALQEIETLSHFGLRVGYIHLYSPETTIPAGIAPRLFELQMAGQVTQLSHDDEAHAKLLVLHDPAIGMFLDQFSSRVSALRSIVVDRQLPTLSGGEARTPVVYSQAIRNLDRVFNTRIEMSGGAVEDHARLRSVVPQERLLSDRLVWSTHIPEPQGEINPPTKKPVVGFHSYGNQYRWPNNADAFREIYVSDSYTTRLFGNLEGIVEKFGEESFSQIDLVKAHEQTESDFLRGIDFWVYFPHYRLQDQSWEQALTAMQAGKVVILPRRLERIYGAAALYCDTYDVSDVILRLTDAPANYVAQARRGQEFIAAGYSSQHFVERIRSLLEVCEP